MFFNIDVSGGYGSQYADTKDPYDSHECFVNGVRCWADEARFGGIVIQAGEPRAATASRKYGAKATADSADPVTDRARGALVGLALGDALGAPVEFEPAEAIRARREELFGLPGGGTFDWAPGEFTDDTQMALVLAFHLRARRGQLEQDALAREFARWAEAAADVGNQTRTVLSAVHRGETWQEALRGLSPDAAGNGSLMRVAPVAIAAASADAAAVLAEAQSVVTHPNETCRQACAFFARLLSVVIETGELDVDGQSASVRAEAVTRAIEASAADAEPEMSGWVLHTLTEALWAVRGATSFEDAIWRAVALGRDADTVGAIAGALAGALWGLQAIPATLSERLQSRHPLFRGDYPSSLIELADELIAARASVPDPEPPPRVFPSQAERRPRASIPSRQICTQLVTEGIMQGGAWLTRPPPALNPRLLAARVRGMLLGVAIGDALGNTSESMHPADRARHLGEIRDYLPNKHAHGRRVGIPSDDTQLTFRTLEQLLADRQLSAVGLLERFASERIFGIGAATREAMALFRAGRLNCTGVKSAGNGGLMRIAPVVLPHLRTVSADLWADAAAATAATHADSMAVASSVAWVRILWELLSRTAAPSSEFWLSRFVQALQEVEAPGELYRPRGGGWPEFEGPLSAYLTGCCPIFELKRPTRQACQLWYSGAFLLETVPSVLYILSRHAGDPEEAMIRAVNDTWDNDTIASIVGGALGALHGPEAFPPRWTAGLLGRTRAEDDGRVFELIDAAVEAFTGV